MDHSHMLHGIDISNWQKGLTIPESLDFCIVKATEGFRFVDPCCDGFVQQCKKKGILFGFYHFARNNDPENEAVFFRNSTKGYELLGIPVLDIEDENIKDKDTGKNKWGEYAQRFIDKYHAITGVYPMVYCSAAYLQRFAGYPLVDMCGLWVAGYPDARKHGINDVPDFPYSVAPWPFAAVWQYTSNGWLPNFAEPIDLDVAYMDKNAWHKYANPDGSSGQTIVMPSPTPSTTNKKYHFSNALLDIDVTVKGGTTNGS